MREKERGREIYKERLKRYRDYKERGREIYEERDRKRE